MYKDLKRLYMIEPYIDDPFIRKELTKFRISAHV